MSKIAFINPPLSHEERYGKFAKAGSHFPPLGLACLAAVTLREGFNTKIIDASALEISYEETTRLISEFNPDCIGITSPTISIYNAAKIAEVIKQKNKNAVIIIGGAHLSAVPNETMKRFPAFDIGVIGEGEITIIELLRTLENKGDLRKVRGLIFRENDALIETGPREFMLNLDSLPMPAWELLPNLARFYRPSPQCVLRLPATTLITGRGCPGRCIFCDRKIFGNKCRIHSAEYILKMIKYLYKTYGVKDFQIDDDTFVMYRQRLVQVCELLRKESLKINWSCVARVNYVEPGILKKMKAAGCWQIQYGIESADENILKFLKKDITVAQIERALRWTKEAGIKTKGFFIIGHPTETLETIAKTIDFICNADLDDFQITIFTPFPGTEIYNIAKEYGTFDDDWKKMNEYNVVFIPNNLSHKDIVYYQKEAFRRFYLRPRIIFSYIFRFKSISSIQALMSGFLGLLDVISFKRKINVN